MMRRLCLATVLGLLPITAAAQPPTVSQGQRIAFDYLDADETTYQVVSFQLQIDGGAWTTTPTQENVFPDTIAGGTTHSVAPALTPGSHTISFRACNTTGCSVGTAPFAFEYAIVPPAGSNVRIVSGDASEPDAER